MRLRPFLMTTLVVLPAIYRMSGKDRPEGAAP